MPPTSRTERNHNRVREVLDAGRDFSTATRLDDADKLALRAAMDAQRAANLDLHELSIRLQRKYGLRDGDNVHRNGTITRTSEGT